MIVGMKNLSGREERHIREHPRTSCGCAASGLRREMSLEPKLHPLASHDLPSFITLPGETDSLMVIVTVTLIVLVISLGVLYLNVHSLPERMSHRSSQVQAGIVSVLCILALFTHNQVLWLMAILLAFIRIPDFETPLQSISESLRDLTVQKAPAPEAVTAIAPPEPTLPEPTVEKQEG